MIYREVVVRMDEPTGRYDLPDGAIVVDFCPIIEHVPGSRGVTRARGVRVLVPVVDITADEYRGNPNVDMGAVARAVAEGRMSEADAAGFYRRADGDR